LLEIVIITVSLVLGGLSVSVLHGNKTISNRIYRSKVKPVKHSIESANHELESLKLERDVLADKINRVFEAKSKGVIDAYERDRLILSCKKQIRSQNLRINELEEFSNYSEILKLRSELVSMLENRISDIDTKLRELSSKLITNNASNLEARVPYVDYHSENNKDKSILWTPMGTDIKNKHLAKEYSYSEEKVQKMEQEVVQALLQLEESSNPQVNIELENNHLADEKMNSKRMHSGDALSFCTGQSVNRK
jgi:hypothetical protein